MKSGFWQIQLHEKDKYKTAFVTPFGQYEWNVMPSGFENAPSKFPNIIFNFISKYSIYWVYLSLLFSSLNKIFKYFTKILLKHDDIISEIWIISNTFIFQDKMTPPKFLSSTEEGKAKLTQLSKQWNFPPIQNPEHLTPAEEGKAKVKKYAEYLAEKLQKIPHPFEV
jgi:hypothetical protein